MSLLSAVLQTAEAIEVNDFKATSNDLCSKLRGATEYATTLACSLREKLVSIHLNYSAAQQHHIDILKISRNLGRIRIEHDQLIAQAKSHVEKSESPAACTKELNSCIDGLERACDKLAKLECIAGASQSISRASTEFGRAECATAIIILDDVILSLSALHLDGEVETMVRTIRSVASGKRALYLTELGQEWEEMLSWSEKPDASHITYSLLVHQGDHPRLQMLLHSLHKVNCLHDELAEFAEFFITKIVKRIINSSCDIFTDENLDTIIFSLKFQRCDDRKPNFKSIFTNLTAVLEFLQSAMDVTFHDGGTFISVLSQVIAGRFFELLITDFIKTYLPICEGSHQQYKLLENELDSFDKFLVDIKFTTKDKSPLKKYLGDTSKILYKKKCDKLLSQVRRLLLESMSHSTLLLSGDENDMSVLNVTDCSRDTIGRPLMLSRCVVSEHMRSVLSLISSHLIESCKMPEQYSSLLVSYIMDIVVMYQTLVPKTYENNLKTNPRDIVIFFNNSFYLAHGLLSMIWTIGLPHPLADTLNTVLAPSLTDLRTLGMQYLSHYLKEKKSFILSTVQPSEQVVWDYDSFVVFERTVKNCKILLKELHNIWIDILPMPMYEKSMSTLVETFCRAVVNKLFSSGNKNIQEDLVLMLANNIEDLVVEIQTLYEDTAGLSENVQVWGKFSKLPLILNAHMLELTQLWDGGAGDIAHSFTCEEIRLVLKMRFPDTERRMKTLAAIQ